MGANRAGERRKRSVKRTLKNWRTRKDSGVEKNFTTVRGATFRPRQVKPKTKRRKG